MTCPLCGESRRWPLRWNVDPAARQWLADHGETKPYTWMLCRQCGNGYPSFQPELALLSFIWNRDRQDRVANTARGDAIWNARLTAARKGASRSFEMFEPLYSARPGRFIDIACGLGETVKYFSDRGWEAFGIDADPTMKPFHEKIGIRSSVGQIETAAIDGKFDIVHISHAMYFITNPRVFLESLQNHLKDDGVLCIVLANFMASDDLSLPGHPHSFFPTTSSMRYLLSIAGYQTIFCHKKSGSVYIAACREKGPMPRVYPRLIRLGYQTKALRYSLIGRPKLLLHRIAKMVLSLAGYR